MEILEIKLLDCKAIKRTVQTNARLRVFEPLDNRRLLELLFGLASLCMLSGCSSSKQIDTDQSVPKTVSSNNNGMTPVHADSSASHGCAKTRPDGTLTAVASKSFVISVPRHFAGMSINGTGTAVAFGVGDSKHFDRLRIVINGHPQNFFDNLDANNGVWDQAGRHLAYAAKNGAQWSVVRDGKSIPNTYDGILQHSIVFDPAGRALAFTAIRNNKAFVNIDGKEAGPFDGASRVAFNGDGSHWSYVANNGEVGHLVTDGVVQTLPHKVDYFPPVWIRDDRFAYALIDRYSTYTYFVIPDRGKQESFSGIGHDDAYNSSLQFSIDRKRFGYFAKMVEGSWTAIIDGSRFGPFSGVGDAPVFSADGKHYAYAAEIGNDWVVVRDGSYYYSSARYKGISFIVFSPDGSSLAYGAKTTSDKWIVSANGCDSPEYSEFYGVGFVKKSVDADGVRFQPAYLVEDSDGVTKLIAGNQYVAVVGKPVFFNLARKPYADEAQVMGLSLTSTLGGDANLSVFRHKIRLN